MIPVIHSQHYTRLNDDLTLESPSAIYSEQVSSTASKMVHIQTNDGRISKYPETLIQGNDDMLAGCFRMHKMTHDQTINNRLLHIQSLNHEQLTILMKFRKSGDIAPNQASTAVDLAVDVSNLELNIAAQMLLTVNQSVNALTSDLNLLHFQLSSELQPNQCRRSACLATRATQTSARLIQTYPVLLNTASGLNSKPVQAVQLRFSSLIKQQLRLRPEYIALLSLLQQVQVHSPSNIAIDQFLAQKLLSKSKVHYQWTFSGSEVMLIHRIALCNDKNWQKTSSNGLTPEQAQQLSLAFKTVLKNDSLQSHNPTEQLALQQFRQKITQQIDECLQQKSPASLFHLWPAFLQPSTKPITEVLAAIDELRLACQHLSSLTDVSKEAD